MSPRAVAVTLLLAISLVGEIAHAEELDWDPHWRRFSWPNAGFTAALGAGALGIALSDFQQEGHRGGVLFDEAVRDGLVGRTQRARNVARIIGDRTFQLALIYPYMVDVVAVAWIGNRSPDVAWQMTLINLQSQGFAALLGLSTAHFIGRARPSSEACEKDSAYERHCGGPDRNASFMSGHTATVATTAGLVCAHNSKLRLYGDTHFGLFECIFGIVAATTTGITRIAADRHWATDVLSGATLGVVSGYVLPMLLHYGWSDSGPPLHGVVSIDDGAIQMVPIPFLRDGSAGLGVGAIF